MLARAPAAAVVAILCGLALCGLVMSQPAHAATSDCGIGPLRAFAREQRISTAERVAVQTLLDRVRAHPVSGLRCSSTFVRLKGGRVLPGTPDLVCLQAATASAMLGRLPVAAPVRRAARRAYRVIQSAEQRGNTFCVVPG